MPYVKCVYCDSCLGCMQCVCCMYLQHCNLCGSHQQQQLFVSKNVTHRGWAKAEAVSDTGQFK